MNAYLNKSIYISNRCLNVLDVKYNPKALAQHVAPY